jgi:hypothetical protein
MLHAPRNTNSDFKKKRDDQGQGFDPSLATSKRFTLCLRPYHHSREIENHTDVPQTAAMTDGGSNCETMTLDPRDHDDEGNETRTNKVSRTHQ